MRSGNDVFEDDVVALSMPLSMRARSFKSMRAYGQQFRVCSSEANLITSDCGVTVTSETVQRSGISDAHTVTGPVTYYGKVQEILELDYGSLKLVVLLCDWVPPISRGPSACEKIDKYGFTLVKLSRLMRRSTNSFVFPLHSLKVFFSNFSEDLEWSAMVHVEPTRSTRVYEDTNMAWSHPYLGQHCVGNDEEEAADDIECSQLGGAAFDRGGFTSC